MSGNFKKLYRSRKNRILFGVCGGLGEYFRIDPIIIRILFVLLAVAHGIGILLYLILVFIVPVEGGKNVQDDKFKEVDEVAKKAKEKAQEIADEIKKRQDQK